MLYFVLQVFHHFIVETRGINLLVYFSCYVAVLTMLLVYFSIDVDLHPKWAECIKRLALLIALCTCVAFIFDIAVFSRNVRVTRVILQPFAWTSECSHEQAKGAIYDIFNMMLFVPYSVLFSNFISVCFKTSVCRSFTLTIVSAGLLSICVEVLQLKFSLGTFETEDIICNVLGAIVGGLPYLIRGLVHSRVHFIN